jgi:hypothetical protein
MISKARFEQIALEVAAGFIKEMEGYSYFGSNPGIPEDDVSDFAHALIAAVEKEAEIAGELVDSGFRQIEWNRKPSVGTKLIALPLVEPEGE